MPAGTGGSRLRAPLIRIRVAEPDERWHERGVGAHRAFECRGRVEASAVAPVDVREVVRPRSSVGASRSALLKHAAAVARNPAATAVRRTPYAEARSSGTGPDVRAAARTWRPRPPAAYRTGGARRGKIGNAMAEREWCRMRSPFPSARPTLPGRRLRGDVAGSREHARGCRVARPQHHACKTSWDGALIAAFRSSRRCRVPHAGLVYLPDGIFLPLLHSSAPGH